MAFNLRVFLTNILYVLLHKMISKNHLMTPPLWPRGPPQDIPTPSFVNPGLENRSRRLYLHLFIWQTLKSTDSMKRRNIMLRSTGVGQVGIECNEKLSYFV